MKQMDYEPVLEKLVPYYQSYYDRYHNGGYFDFSDNKVSLLSDFIRSREMINAFASGKVEKFHAYLYQIIPFLEEQSLDEETTAFKLLEPISSYDHSLPNKYNLWKLMRSSSDGLIANNVEMMIDHIFPTSVERRWVATILFDHQLPTKASFNISENNWKGRTKLKDFFNSIFKMSFVDERIVFLNSNTDKSVYTKAILFVIRRNLPNEQLNFNLPTVDFRAFTFDYSYNYLRSRPQSYFE